MPQDIIEARRQGSFSMDDPMQSLLHDHHYLRQLMQRYLSTQDVKVKRQAGPQICQALQLHTSLEESVFYPRVESLDAALVSQCESDHQHADELIEQLQSLEPGEPRYDALMQELHATVTEHIETEEQQLFPIVRQSSMDLQDLALRMQAYESSILSSQAAASSSTSRRGNQQH